MFGDRLVVNEELKSHVYDNIYNGNYVIYVLNRMLNLIDVDEKLLSNFDKNVIELMSDFASVEISYYDSRKNLLTIIQNAPEYINQMSVGYIKKDKLLELYKSLFPSIFDILVNNNDLWINSEVNTIRGLINIDEKIKDSLKKNVQTFIKIYLDLKNEDRNIMIFKLTMGKVLNNTLACSLVVED